MEEKGGYYGLPRRGEGMKKSDSAAYYHVCTDGNALEWMFRDTADFIAGMNRIGICAAGTAVIVVAFILMDNHVHFVLYGTMPQCKKFITKYKMLTGKWIGCKYGVNHYLKHLPTTLIRIHDEEQLLETIAYVDRNSIIAGYHHLPGEYPWGSARYMFKEKSIPESRTLSEINKKEIRRLLNTWADIPLDWCMDSDGMLLPECYFDVESAERLFKSPLKYLYFLSRKLEGKIEMLEGTKAFIPDRELRPLTESLAEQLFGNRDIRQLDFNSRILLARKLRYNYASTPKQISRMVYLDSEALIKFI